MSAPVLMDGLTGEIMPETVWDGVSLHIPENTSFEDWEALGRSLQQMEKSVMWWIGDWLRFGEANYGEKYTQAIEATGLKYQRLANAKYVAGVYSEISCRQENLSFSHHFEAASLPFERRHEVLDIAVRDNLSTHDLRALIKGEKTPHVTNNSGNNEWYSPAPFVEAARVVMGDIDLDPASSLIANKTVRAATIYTAEDDGLAQDWPVSRIWMNPPYAQPLMSHFASKFAAAIRDGSEGVVLVNNATETGWFQEMAAECAAICFPKTRVRFMDPAGELTGAPLQGQAIIYAGPNTEAFIREFSHFGFVVRYEQI